MSQRLQVRHKEAKDVIFHGVVVGVWLVYLLSCHLLYPTFARGFTYAAWLQLVKDHH